MESTSNHEEEWNEGESDDDFYFESDHLALRDDPDYISVIRTIAILQAQRIQATKDIDTISIAERDALNDPEQFLLQLTKGEELNVPGPISVCEVSLKISSQFPVIFTVLSFQLPKINFEKYQISVPEFPQENIETSNKSNDITVRGRMFDQSKPETFNQLWTCEEQRRLEELLVEFPPEPIEMQRFAKIAGALGNRTTKQVASRLQKYFKKLHSAGMPVPGRIPKNHRSCLPKNNKLMKLCGKKTTFFPANYVPVNMNDDDDYNALMNFNLYGKESSTGSVTSYGREQTITNTIVVDQDSDEDESQSSSNELRMIKLIKRVKRDKERYTNSKCKHYGYKCDFCGEDPVAGTRWHCQTCSDSSIDFCSDCIVTQLSDNLKCHPIQHKIVGLRVSDAEQPNSLQQTQSDMFSDDEDDFFEESREPTGYDKDYIVKPEDYNYLDSNFMPQ